MGISKLNYVADAQQNWHAGMISFLAQRVTGLALTLYLVLHILSLSSVLISGEAFEKTMAAYASGLFFHIGEWLLLVAVVFHMLNGLRIIAADWFGITRLHRSMFWMAATATAAICLVSVPYFFMGR